MIKSKRQLRAQTAMELAVFGAILIFVVGVIVRQALSSAYMQNQNLRAMRQAMTTSYQYSMAQMGAERQASRRSATILFIEDRLTAESGRHAAADRTPYVTGGSASYSKTLFYPLDAGETLNLPIYDVFINGKHFSFTTSGFRNVELAKSCAGVSPCPPECNLDCGSGPPSTDTYVVGTAPCALAFPCPAACLGDCSDTSTGVYPVTAPCAGLDPCPAACGSCSAGESVQFYPGNLSCAGISPCPAACLGNCSDTSTGVYPVDWENDCAAVNYVKSGPCQSGCEQPDCCTEPWCGLIANQFGGGASCGQVYIAFNPPRVTGCAKLYGITYNHPGFAEWCSGLGACPGGNLTADERFDLDRDGTTDVPVGDRPTFAWQWYEITGWNARSDLASATSLRMHIDSSHVNVDVDRDLKLESVFGSDENGRTEWLVTAAGVDNHTGVITSLQVLDNQAGDLDMTRGDSDTGPAPGLQKNARMYSFVNGSYLLLEEGQLYAPDTGRYIRTAQKKDQVDIIERTFQLSNNTGRFCSGNTPNADGNLWSDMPNSVEACENCYSSANVQRTCIDRVRKVILVRSRIQDLRGRKWVTNTGGDDNVDFTVPPVP